MPLRFIISLALFYAAFFILQRLNLRWDPVFVFLVFMSFSSEKMIWPLMGIASCAIWDHLLFDSIPFYTIAGVIIFLSASWLRSVYPYVKKPLAVILLPIYSQFLWFMLLFGYYFREGVGAVGSGYFAPFLIGNTIFNFCLAIVLFGLLARDKRRDFSPSLLSR